MAAAGSPSENAHAFAILNMAMSDAAVATFDTKYEYNFWRPKQRFHMGKTDGNPATEGDASFIPWLSLLVSPAIPPPTPR